MKKIASILSSIALLFAFAQTSRADLFVSIVGDPGSGQTTWTFSGSEIAGGQEDFDSGFLSDFGSVWVDHGDLFNSGWTNENIVPPSGATVTTPFGTRNIDLLYMTEQDIADDFGIGVDGTNLPFDAGDLVTWDGSFVLNEDILNMNEGSYSFDYFANIFGTLDLTVEIRAASVPEPASTVALGILGLACVCRRRRN
ncbi:MAG: PEP-CTERM sorting domain-containing protein [Mariniblastus sp.]